MPLDFAVLGAIGTPEDTVSIDVDLHHELMRAAAETGLSAFRGFADYYCDAEVAADDLRTLQVQVQFLLDRTESLVLAEFLCSLEKLIHIATARQCSLHVIAD